MEPQRYSVNQDGNEFILSTKVFPDRVKIECQDNNYAGRPNYARDYTLEELRSVSKIFDYANSASEVQTQIDNAIENQNVSLNNKGDILEVTFTIEIQNNVAEITFQLPRDRLQYESSKFQKPTETQTQIVVSDTNPNNYYKTTQYVPIINRSIESIIKEPIYKEEIINPNNYINENQIIYQYAPDVSYSSHQKILYPIQKNQNFNYNCSCPLDHERINNLEGITINLKTDHDELKYRINNLKQKINILKRQTAIIKNENNVLNTKTLNLKRINNQLIEAESNMRTENDFLKRENQGLLLKKSQLEFYLNNQHDHNTVQEVNIPFVMKRTRPTAVSKKDKFYSGLTSTNNYYRKIGNISTAGSLNNRSQMSNFRGGKPGSLYDVAYSSTKTPYMNNTTNVSDIGYNSTFGATKRGNIDDFK